MRFAASHLNRFLNASGDLNPLHFDPEYCRKTYFGSPVVQGMATVLYGLGLWAQDRPFALESMRGSFNKPLFPDLDYDFQVSESEGRVDVRIFKGPVLRSGFEFTARLTETPSKRPLAKNRVERLSAPQDFSAPLKDFRYEPDEDGLEALFQAYPLKRDQLPRYQLNALLGLSYLVGMVHPGKRGLFSEFDLVFGKDAPATDAIDFTSLRASLDERYNRVEITGQATGLTELALAAFLLPEQFHYPLESIEAAVGRSNRFSGQRALITGGSRGLGLVLAKAFALQGAEVVITCQSSAEALTEAFSAGEKIRAIQADLSDDESCSRLAAQLAAGGKKIDILVDNAFPFIPRQMFAEQKPKEITDWLLKAVRMSSQLHSHALPILSGNATVVHVSSIATQKPEQQLSHYVAAKSAVEGLVKTMAKEMPRMSFVIVRPTRMLTNSSNFSTGTAGALSPVDVAKELLDCLRQRSEGRNLHELNLE